jgi:hypothetical protein
MSGTFRLAANTSVLTNNNSELKKKTASNTGSITTMVSCFQKLQRTHNPFALRFQLSCKNQMNRNFRYNAYQNKAVIVSDKFGNYLCSFISLTQTAILQFATDPNSQNPFATNETEPKTHLVMIMNLVFHFSYYEVNFNWKTKKTL